MSLGHLDEEGVEGEHLGGGQHPGVAPGHGELLGGQDQQGAGGQDACLPIVDEPMQRPQA